MSEVIWGKTMEQLKEQLPVNEELKHKLHQSLLRKRRQGRIWRGVIAGITAASLLFGGIVLKPWEQELHVSAASLHVASQFVVTQQLGRENSVSVAQHGDTTYFAVEKEGIYAQTDNGLKLLLSGGAESVAVSPDGRELAYVQNGDVHVYDVKRNETRLLLRADEEGENREVGYTSPTWSQDGKRIAVVRLTENRDEAGKGDGEREGDTVNLFEADGKIDSGDQLGTERRVKTGDQIGTEGKAETGDQLGAEDKAVAGEMLEVEVKSGATRLLGVGASPSYVPGQRALLFEREGAILSLNLKSGEERKLAEGRYPSVSPDGEYVAFVVARGNPAMEDLWIAEIDFTTRKILIENQLAEAWDRATGSPIEGEQQAQFTVDQPVWNQDGGSLLVYKTFYTNEEWRKLVRLEVTEKESTPEEIVASSIAALIYRDEEYAHSFFSYDPGYLKGTSPRQVGYSILSSGVEEGLSYVDAETYLSYADPYYAIQKTRYYLSKGELGYRINDMRDLSYTEISMWDGSVYLSVDGVREEEPLFKLSELPEADGCRNNGIDNLVYRESEQTLWLTLKREKEGQTSLSLISYDLMERKWTEWSSYDEARSHMLLVAEDGEYVSMDLTMNGRAEVVVYDVLGRRDSLLSKRIEGIPPDDVHTRFWKDGALVYFAEVGGRDLLLTFDPK